MEKLYLNYQKIIKKKFIWFWMWAIGMGKMGAIAEKYATKIFLTDNSRSESPDEIIDMIAAGIKDKLKIQVNIDRERLFN